MHNDDILASAGAAFSGLCAFVSYLWSIPLLQFGFTFILGTFVTYLVQSRLQDRSDRRKIIRENIEKMYGPLKLELQEYKKSLTDGLEVPRSLVGSTDQTRSTWERIKTYPESFSIPPNLQLQLEEITNIEQSIMRTLDENMRLVDSFILHAAQLVLGERLEKSGLTIGGDSSSETLYVTVASHTGMHYGTYSLHDCLLLNEDPIELARKKLPEFSIDKSTLHIICYRKTSQTYPPQTTTESLDLSLRDIQAELRQILKEAAIVKGDKRISKLLKDRDELSERIDKTLPMIDKYIAKHYPVVEL